MGYFKFGLTQTSLFTALQDSNLPYNALKKIYNNYFKFYTLKVTKFYGNIVSKMRVLGQKTIQG